MARWVEDGHVADITFYVDVDDRTHWIESQRVDFDYDPTTRVVTPRDPFFRLSLWSRNAIEPVDAWTHEPSVDGHRRLSGATVTKLVAERCETA